MSRAVIAIDLDATMHAYSRGWDGGRLYEPPIKGTVEAIKRLAKDYTLVVFTARIAQGNEGQVNKMQYRLVQNWLNKYEIAQYFSRITHIKTPDITVIIDDRAVNFDGDWRKAVRKAIEIIQKV